MPLKQFICPDSEKIDTAGCLKACRMATRCFPLPVLKRMAHIRPQMGKWSVTELTSPSWYKYLERTHDYAEQPRDLLFKVLGSAGHYFLEPDTDNHLTEERFECELFSGMIDGYDGESETLFDYKFLGKYKVDLMRKNIKTAEDYIWQGNGYKYLLEHNGFVVRQIVLVAIVRDFRNYEYKKEKEAEGKEITRGYRKGEINPPATEPIYQFELPMLSPEEVLSYFTVKRDILNHLIETQGKDGEICSEEERWQDRRCKDWCGVNFACPHWQELQKKNTVETKLDEAGL